VSEEYVCQIRNTYRLKNCTSSKLTHLLDTASKFVLFLKDEKLVKSKPP